MKIWGEIPKILGVNTKHNSVNKVDKTSGVAAKKDVLSISNTAKDFQTVLKALKDVPDIRQDKVNEMVEKYESGKYDVGGRDIADKILKSTFDKKGQYQQWGGPHQGVQQYTCLM
jgi:negative regulator of flagellin synthesis FlgM